MRMQKGDTILNFIIVGFILMILVATGLYVVRQQIPSTSVVQPVATQPTTPKVQKESSPKNSTAPSTSTLPSSSALPQTGPPLSIVSLISVFLLVFVGTAYLQSRRI
jgi:hypothetical protein